MRDQDKAAELTLAHQQTQRLLVRAGTTVWVRSGSALVRGPLEWLAETMLAPEQRLGPEQRLELADGGWIDLVGLDEARLVLLPPARAMATPWERLLCQIRSWRGRLLAAGTGADKAALTTRRR